ncbi:hypothetical protein PVAP13_6KG044100 [Panicum virgatum]|uniref:Disease resistance protein At4g27190-like leucine-rich repeats domain-containing protein n=2 Tax=Panicum virgatum TaxID=38727 RepID=A0A8T0R6F3_PANVG|nr:hypothetical protein PVAP13_6KG044100 [Panicum virgatum]
MIPELTREIYNDLKNSRFLVVFHNGSGSYIDLRDFGVPIIGNLSMRVLWTSQGRFRLQGIQEEDVKKLAGLSNVAISADLLTDHILDSVAHLLQTEAEEVVKNPSLTESDMSPKIVMECIFYIALRGGDGIDWFTHASNYWVCDGIIQTGTDDGHKSAWDTSEALHENMRMDNWHQVWEVNIRDAIGLLFGDEECRPTDRWFSATRQYLEQKKQGGGTVPPQATSFFWTAAGPISDAMPILEGSMFGSSDRSLLRVIHLSHCTFSFSCHPFSSCNNIRFLLLDHCKDMDAAAGDRGEGKHHHSQGSHDDGSCFRKLWVLDLSYTDWYWLLSEEMMDLMVDLRELNVKGVKNWSISNLCRRGSGTNTHRLIKLCKIRVIVETSGIHGGHIEKKPSLFVDLSSSTILSTVILDNCIDLEGISFRGCANLKSLFLRGFFRRLVELDMSGTAVETLDLSALEARKLRRLFLLGCEKLHAILWPQEKSKQIKLKVLQIDTTRAAWDNKEDMSKKQVNGTDNTVVGSPSATVLDGNVRALTDLDSYISLRDARLFRSLHNPTLVKSLCYIEISSALTVITPTGHRNTSHQETRSSAEGIEQQGWTVGLQRHWPAGSMYVNDVFAAVSKGATQAGGGDNGGGIDAPDVITSVWNCPPIPTNSDWPHCYIILQDEARTGTKQETGATTTLPGFVATNAMTLHVHDSLSITCIPGPSIAAAEDLTWEYILRWCRLERCPNLQGTIFTAPSLRQNQIPIFYCLETFWASQLLKARYIWDWTASRYHPRLGSFEDLVFLHLDYCPRLVHVLPLYTSNSRGCQSLETLEIVCCGDLREVFPLINSESQQQEPRKFGNLKRIRLYELPMLQSICGRRMSAPNLETVKIRGCWSLRSLPSVCRPNGSGSTSSLPTVDCEKDWWDGLVWDGLEANHHPSLYKTAHSAYYKKTLRRTTVLR